MFTIGIFDSGVGGLTIAKAISDKLPNNRILYVGDTANAPWGGKSQEQIVHYSKRLTRFLLNHNCDFVVIACNTASSIALDSLKAAFPGMNFFDVISPIINYLKKLNLQNFNDIGIIGTKQTIKSQAYQKHISEIKLELNIRDRLHIKSLATPLLVPIIEEGWKDHAVSKLVVAEYLSKLDLQDQSILILGCTHYPLIKQQIESFYLNANKKITIIDSINAIAEEITIFIESGQATELPCGTAQRKIAHFANADNIGIVHGMNNFYCTCNNQFFTEIAKQFFANVKLSFLPLWQ